MNSLISIRNITRTELLNFCHRAQEIDRNPFPNTLAGKIIATAFFEPSTRTKLSFETATMRAGAQILHFPTDASSLQKGESFKDTIRMIGSYADAIIIRHPDENTSQLASEITTCAIINAGDGKNEHPSQTLLDLYTIFKDRGSLDNFTITIAGDLRYGRTVHSLVCALLHFDVKIILASPEGLQLPQQFKELIADKIILETTTLEETLNTDYCYITRVQKERFEQTHTFNENDWILDKETVSPYPKLKILHPLPRLYELQEDLDETTHALYFEQAKNGIPIRIAILEYAIGVFDANS